jgi:hypothetical protein
MQKIIQIYQCLLKLSRKQENVTDGQTDSRYYYILSPLSRGENKKELLNAIKRNKVSKNIKNGHHTKAVLFAMNYLENDYTPVTSFSKCKLKLKRKM